MGASHRAVIERVYPQPSLQLLAIGTREECRAAIARELARRPLDAYENPRLLTVDGAWLPTSEDELLELVRTDPGVAALFHIATEYARRKASNA